MKVFKREIRSGGESCEAVQKTEVFVKTFGERERESEREAGRTKGTLGSVWVRRERRKMMPKLSKLKLRGCTLVNRNVLVEAPVKHGKFGRVKLGPTVLDDKPGLNYVIRHPILQVQSPC